MSIQTITEAAPAEPKDDLGYLTNRVARLLRQRLGERVSDLGLTPVQAAVLLSLGAGGPFTVSQVADRLGIDRPTMTGLVERLLRDGRVQTRPNPADGRSKLLLLTDSSRAELPRLREASSAVQGDLAATLGVPGAAELAQLLRAAADALAAPEVVTGD